MKTDIPTNKVIRITLSILLDKRASTIQDNYIHSSSKATLARFPVCGQTSRYRDYVTALRQGLKIPCHEGMVRDMFALVCQSYRLNGWELEDLVFER